MRPEQRVFHIDNECYIVYLGRHPNDYKPFLRIGNSPNLDQEIKSLVYSVVVTDNLTGNPLDEAVAISEVPNDEFRYIGDPKTVETFKSFLKHQEIPTGKYQANGADSGNERGVYVYFYDNGNLKLRFETKPIFDLETREERDRHFPQRCKEIKNNLLKNPLRQDKRALEKPGFFVVGGSVYLFDRSNALAFSLADDTFVDLASHGIDPDAVTAVIHADGDLALERWLKRLRQKNGRGKVLTDNPEGVRGLIDLFRKLPTRPARVEQIKFDAGGSQSFFGLTVHRLAGGYTVDAHNGVVLALGSAETSSAQAGSYVLRLDGAARSWKRESGKQQDSGALIEAVPYRLRTEAPVVDEKTLNTYLHERPGDFTGVFTDEQAQVLDQARRAFDGLLDGRDPSGPVRTIRSIGKAAGSQESPYFTVAIHNARELIRLFIHEKGERSDAGKNAQALDRVLKSVESPLASAQLTGVACDFCVTDAGAYQLFPLQNAVTVEQVERNATLGQEMKSAFFDEDEDAFVGERKRLDAVIAELHPKRSRQRVKESTSEKKSEKKGEATNTGDTGDKEGEKKAAADAAADAGAGPATEVSSGKPAATRSSGGDAAAAGGKGGDSAGGSGDGSGRRRGLLVAAAAVLLVALLAVLFGTGVIDLGGVTGPGEEGEPTVASNGTGTNGTVSTGEDDRDTDGEASDGATSAGDGQAVIGDTTNVTPAVREFIETLDLENPPEGLEAREGAGGIIITILDIIRLANRIAVDNGYRELGAPPGARPDPDWIYPGNVFELPDGSTHTVVSGDTLWDITGEFIQEQLAGRYSRYAAVMEDYQTERIEIEALVEELTDLRNNTYSENFRNIINQTIEEVASTD
jgi:hypothetical protein